MKLIYTTLGCLLLCLSLSAQNQGKAEDLVIAKLNILGASIAYEKAITDEFVVEGEFAYFGFFFSDDFPISGLDEGSGFVFVPQLSIEPKYYYNFDRRIEKGKRTTNNSANFFSVSLFYLPGSLAITSSDVTVDGTIYGIVPKYGFRRAFGKHFGFEFAIGVGYARDNDSDGDSRGIPIPALNASFTYAF